MALIKCPECKKNISSEAVKCPHCGYEIVTTRKKAPQKFSFIYLIIIVAIIGGCVWYFTKDKKDETTNPQTETATEKFISTYYNISFNYPKGMKVITPDDGTIYISNNNSSEAAIPYVAIYRYDNFNSFITFFNSLTSYMMQQYGTSFISASEVKTGTIGNKTVAGIGYKYLINGNTIVDNRYAVIINNKVYSIFTKSVNTADTNLDNTATLIIQSITEGGN